MGRLFWLAPLLLSCSSNFNQFSFNGDGGGGGDGSGVVGDLSMPPDMDPCPTVFGRYTINQQGDCGDLNDKAPECAMMTTGACFVHLVSAPLNMTGAVNGGITIDSAGHFSGQLILGTTTFPNCMGTFDATKNQLDITCQPLQTGGNACMLTLTRAANQCG
jgi:hypothetical protein